MATNNPKNICSHCGAGTKNTEAAFCWFCGRSRYGLFQGISLFFRNNRKEFKKKIVNGGKRNEKD